MLTESLILLAKSMRAFLVKPLGTFSLFQQKQDQSCDGRMPAGHYLLLTLQDAGWQTISSDTLPRSPAGYKTHLLVWKCSSMKKSAEFHINESRIKGKKKKKEFALDVLLPVIYALYVLLPVIYWMCSFGCLFWSVFSWDAWLCPWRISYVVVLFLTYDTCHMPFSVRAQYVQVLPQLTRSWRTFTDKVLLLVSVLL